jgi:hypothetical protein
MGAFRFVAHVSATGYWFLALICGVFKRAEGPSLCQPSPSGWVIGSKRSGKGQRPGRYALGPGFQPFQSRRTGLLGLDGPGWYD